MLKGDANRWGLIMEGAKAKAQELLAPHRGCD